MGKFSKDVTNAPLEEALELRPESEKGRIMRKCKEHGRRQRSQSRKVRR